MEWIFRGGKGAFSIGIPCSDVCDASLLGCLPEPPGMAAAASSLSFGKTRAWERRRSCCALRPAGNMSLGLNSFPHPPPQNTLQALESAHQGALAQGCFGPSVLGSARNARRKQGKDLHLVLDHLSCQTRGSSTTADNLCIFITSCYIADLQYCCTIGIQYKKSLFADFLFFFLFLLGDA